MEVLPTEGHRVNKENRRALICILCGSQKELCGPPWAMYSNSIMRDSAYAIKLAGFAKKSAIKFIF